MMVAGYRVGSQVSRAVVVAATISGSALVLASIAPAAAATHASGPRVAPTRVASPSTGTSATNPYGNPYNSYLRQPYGVLPQGDAGTPPVQDNPNEPFDFYRSPRAGLGILGGPQSTMLSPEGFLETDFGRLEFFTGSSTGSSLTPINKRVKTWKDGWLPIAEFTQDRGGAAYHFEYFTAAVPGVTQVPVSTTYGVGNNTTTVNAQADNPINFAKVTITNTTSAATTFRLGVGLNPQPVDFPVHRGAPLPANLTYDPSDQALEGQAANGSKQAVAVVSSPPTSVVGGSNNVLSYSVSLPPGGQQSFVVKMPYWVAQQSDVATIRAADYAAELSATEDFWQKELAQTGSHVDIPEAKVEDAYKANIVSLLINAVEKIGNHWNLLGNPSVYHHFGFFIRDAAFHIEALLDAGFFGIVRNILQDYPAWQDPSSGRYEDLSGEFDSNGEGLWAIGQYVQRTHDAAFARFILPSVKKAMAWQQSFRTDGGQGLYPVTSMHDDEEVTGHIVGFNLWAISGGLGAVQVARVAGDSSDADMWANQMAQYKQVLIQELQPEFSQLHVVAPTTEGINGQGLDVNGWYGGAYGIDWGNLGLVWPSGVFSPNDPMVTSSLKVWQQQTFEGIFTYPTDGAESVLHSYSGLSIPETDLRAGDQSDALKYLYNTLVHTSAMDMASEGINAAGRWDWGPSTDTEPHNQFSAELISVTHDMLAYGGEDGSLHLASVNSPAWDRPGQHTAFSGTTSFGPMSYTETFGAHGMTMQLTPPTRTAPNSIVVSVPENVTVTGVAGVPGASVHGQQVVLPAVSHPVALHVSWATGHAAPPYSYARAVSDYLANYHKMVSAPEVSMQGLSTSASTVTEGNPVTVSADVVNTGGAGRLADPTLKLYGDGKITQTDATTLGRGIGFTTPSGVISFGHHAEGTVPVSFSDVICGVGTHNVSIGLGSNSPMPARSVEVQPPPPTAPAPPAKLSFPGLQVLYAPGKQTTLTVGLTNTGCEPITGATVSLNVPNGWTISPSGPVTVGTVAPGATGEATFQVTPGGLPPGSQIAQQTVSATTSYGWSGTTTGQAQASSTVLVGVPDASVADVYNNIGITNDDNPGPGNFDNNGDSYSAQALAEVGLQPGQPFVHDGITFTWPNEPAGQPDNVAGQALVQVPGQGSTLGIIGAGVFDQTGTGTIFYTDGTSQQFSIFFPNWAISPASGGAEEVVNCPYRNTPSGPANFGLGYRVFYNGIPLASGKSIAAVLLPDNPQLHVFTMQVG